MERGSEFATNYFTLIASASGDSIRIWSTDVGECIVVLEGHCNSVTSVVFSHDSTLIASGSQDNTIRI